MCFPSVVFLLFEINSMNKFFRSHFGSRLKDLARLGLWCVISSLVVFLIFYLSHLIQWIFTKIQWILPKFDRLVLGCINEFLNFFFEFVESVLLIRSFVKKNAKIRKKRERKIWTKITIFRIFTLWDALFWQSFLELLIFWRYSRQDLVAF